jgi:hypothetical protein
VAARSAGAAAGALPYLQQDGHACGGSAQGPQSAPTVYKPANAQCPAGWFSSGARADRL